MNKTLAKPSRRRVALACALAATCLTASAVTRSSPAPVIGGAADIRVDDAWIHALPGPVSVAYATFVNSSDTPVNVVDASAAIAAWVELDRTTGPHRMMRVKNFYIKPHSSLSLQTNQLHMSLNRPKSALTKGEQVPILLKFSDGSSVTVPFEVR